MIRCPSDADLQELLADRLAEDARTPVVQHVEICAACQQRLDSLTHADELQLATSQVGAAGSADGPTFLQRLQAEYPSTLMQSEPRLNGALHFPGPVSDRAPLGEIGDFDVLEELGSGTFGWVFRARERSLDRIVALKVLKPEMTVRADALARFEREARKASLRHDHIVCVHRFEKPYGFPPYLVMEFVAGETLEARLKREGKLSPVEAAAIARQVALGLAAAHEHGMVHRDVKPANILLDQASGRAKISDFGLARDIADESMAVTAAGELAGTAPYMSPEHFRTPDKVDGRSDIFSLGIVLYQLLTGQVPFRGSFLQIRSGILEDEPSAPRRLNDSIPADLETITLACLHKDPQRRYASASAVADDLRRFQNGEPILCRPTGHIERILKWVQRKPAQAALVGVASIAVAFLAFLIFGIFVNVHLQAINSELFTAKGELKATNDQLVGEKGQIKKLNYVADMNLAHQAWQNDNFQLLEQYLAPYGDSDQRGFEWHYLRWLSRSDGRRIGPKEPVSTLAFDPSGRLLALGVLTGKEAQIQIWHAPTDDRPAGALLYSLPGQEDPLTDLAFHPKRELLVAADREGTILLWDYKKGKVIHTISGNGPLAISANGESLAYVRLDGAAQRWSFADKRDIGSPLTFAIGSVANMASKGRDPAVAFERSDKGKMRGGFDKGSMKGRGSESGKKGRGGDAPSSGIEQLAFSADGQRLFIVGGHYKRGGLLAAWDLKSGQRLAFDDARQDDILAGVALSLDGKSIAAAGYDHVLRVWDVATGKLRFRRLAHKLEGLTVAFNNRGNLLASAGWDQTIKIWNAATGEELGSLHGNRGIVRQVAFSPQAGGPGRDRLVSLNDQGELRWWDPTQEQTARVTRLREPVHALAFSPQGRYLAAFGRGTQVLVQGVNQPGQRHELVLSAVGARGVFSQDEATLFIAAENGLVQTWPFARAAGAAALPRTALIAGQRLLLSDGKQWLVSPANPPAQEPLKNLISFGASPNPLPTIVAIDTSGHRLAYVDGAGRIMVRERDESGDIAADRALSSDKVRAGVNTLSFSPDGSLLASGNQDNSILLWDVPTGSVRHHLTGHLCFVSCVAFSPDGRRLASGSEDWTVKIWDIGVGRATLTLGGHKGRIRDLAFSPDGTSLASASEDGTLRVWPTSQDELSRPATPHSRPPEPMTKIQRK